VLSAIQRALAGGNESARVAAVRLLADLEPYRKNENDDHEREAERAARLVRAEEKLAALVRDAVRAIVRGDTGNQPAWVQELAAELKADGLVHV